MTTAFDVLAEPSPAPGADRGAQRPPAGRPAVHLAGTEPARQSRHLRILRDAGLGACARWPSSAGTRSNPAPAEIERGWPHPPGVARSTGPTGGSPPGVEEADIAIARQHPGADDAPGGARRHPRRTPSRRCPTGRLGRPHDPDSSRSGRVRSPWICVWRHRRRAVQRHAFGRPAPCAAKTTRSTPTARDHRRRPRHPAPDLPESGGTTRSSRARSPSPEELRSRTWSDHFHPRCVPACPAADRSSPRRPPSRPLGSGTADPGASGTSASLPATARMPRAGATKRRAPAGRPRRPRQSTAGAAPRRQSGCHGRAALGPPRRGTAGRRRFRRNGTPGGEELRVAARHCPSGRENVSRCQCTQGTVVAQPPYSGPSTGSRPPWRSARPRRCRPPRPVRWSPPPRVRPPAAGRRGRPRAPGSPRPPPPRAAPARGPATGEPRRRGPPSGLP